MKVLRKVQYFQKINGNRQIINTGCTAQANGLISLTNKIYQYELSDFPQTAQIHPAPRRHRRYFCLPPLVGVGIWISLAAAVATLAAALVLRNPGDTIKSGFDSWKQELSGLAGPATSVSGAAKPRNGASSQGNGSLNELERLIELKNQGKISEEEYQRMKSKIL